MHRIWGTAIKMLKGQWDGDNGGQAMTTIKPKGWQEKQVQIRAETTTGSKQVKEQEATIFDGNVEGICA